MSMSPRVPSGTTGPSHSLNLRRFAAVTGTALLAAAVLPTGTAYGLAAPTTTRAVAAPATTGAASSVAAAAGATSVGKLVPSGCAVTGTTDACDLYAAAGSALVAGQSLPIWGFSTTDPAAATNPGTPTAPGPNLVVNQGDTVTITLHNGLPAGQVLSLAFPGLSATQFTAGLGQAGAPVGSTATYTFTASTPGTFLYEAGHAGDTGDGSRQAAMGLGGALVVLPSDQATRADFQDESVLVLSEIDPGLAADPTGYDLRKYTPSYRLVNGNTAPEIPAIATNAGNTVKLHYVNLGLRQHPMTVLGTTQRTTARDGHDLTYPTGEVTAVLEPGTTEDTLVSIPDDGTSRFTLYESGGHLQSNGQAAAPGSTQTAFGGMLTALDTNAPVATTDTVGPKATAVTLDPAVATGRSDVTVTATLDDRRSGGSTIQAAEYLIDDPASAGVGGGVPMTVTDTTAQTTTVTGTLTAAQMATLGGKHTIYVRGEDSSGNWGAVASGTLTVQGYGAVTTSARLTPGLTNLTGTVTIDATGDASATGGTVTGAEYWLGAQPTDAQLAAGGTPMRTNRTATIVAETAVVPPSALAGLTEGPHTAWVRSQDDRGLWGPLAEVDFTVDLTGPTTVAGLMPNPTNGLIAAPGTPGFAAVSASVDDGSTGSTIADAEAFINPKDITTVTNGTGLQLVPIQPTLNSTLETFTGQVPLAQLRSLANGTYNLYVHGKDAAGNWGAFQVSTFEVDKTAPTLGALTVPSTTNGAATITVNAPYTDNSTHNYGAAEFWWGTTDPGVGKGTPVQATPGNGTITIAALPTTGVSPGQRQLNVRVMDLAGNWSTVQSATLTVTAPTLVAETFSGPLSSAWTTTGTGVTVTGGVLQVSSPSATAYLTTPASVSRAVGRTITTARVTLDVDGTGVTRAGWTTIASAGQGSVEAFGLQVQRANGGQLQLRTVMDRPGVAPVYGTPVVLPTGRATVTLVWIAGPKRATSTVPGGLLTLSLNGSGTPSSSTTGATSGLSVTGVSLGVVSTPAAPGLRQTLRLDNLTVTP